MRNARGCFPESIENDSQSKSVCHATELRNSPVPATRGRDALQLSTFYHQSSANASRTLLAAQAGMIGGARMTDGLGDAECAAGPPRAGVSCSLSPPVFRPPPEIRPQLWDSANIKCSEPSLFRNLPVGTFLVLIRQGSGLARATLG